MAITKEEVVVKKEVVGEHKIIQVRVDTIIKEDGVEISRSAHRHMLAPNMDISNEKEEVQNLCNLEWTDEIKTIWQTKLDTEMGG